MLLKRALLRRLGLAIRQRLKSFLLGAVLAEGLCPLVQAQSVDMLTVKPFKEAAVVLNTGTILTGHLNLFPERDELKLICANDSTYTLDAGLVRGFSAKDDPIQLRKSDTYITLLRIYRTFPLVNRGKESVANGFYEQLSRGPGPILLLRREHVVSCEVLIIGNNTGANGERRSIMINTDPCETVSTLFLSKKAGEVVLLRKPQDVLGYFPQIAPQLRSYMAQNDLSYANLRDLSLLVNYANTLIKKTL